MFEVEQADDVGVVEVFEEISLLECDILVCLHQLHGSSQPCLNVADQVHCAEVTAPHLLQLLVFQHRHLLYANHSLTPQPEYLRYLPSLENFPALLMFSLLSLLI